MNALEQTDSVDSDARSALARMQHMSGALSHDLNNYTGIIQGYVELMRLELEPEHECQSYLDRLQQVCDKMLERSRTLETFSAKRSLPLSTCNLAELVALELEGKQGMLLEAEPGDFAVAAERDTLRAALRQLLENAQEASPDAPVTVHLWSDSEAVYLDIQNSGGSGDPQRWFDPFYTTRGRGRGLGLSRVYGLISAHKAGLEARLDEDGRTMLRIRFSRDVERSLE